MCPLFSHSAVFVKECAGGPAVCPVPLQLCWSNARVPDSLAPGSRRHPFTRTSAHPICKRLVSADEPLSLVSPAVNQAIKTHPKRSHKTCPNNLFAHTWTYIQRRVFPCVKLFSLARLVKLIQRAALFSLTEIKVFK